MMIILYLIVGRRRNGKRNKHRTILLPRASHVLTMDCIGLNHYVIYCFLRAHSSACNKTSLMDEEAPRSNCLVISTTY